MKPKILILSLIFLLSFTSGCFVWTAKQNLKLTLGETKLVQLKDDINFEDNELYILKNPELNDGKYKVVITTIPFFSNKFTHYFYLLKDDVLVYYGYPNQLLMNDDDKIRIAGEEASDILIQKEYINK